MAKKIPPEAFEQYMALGPGRSYQAVAAMYGVTKRAVTNLALRERWQERAAEIEARAREAATQKAVETLEAVKMRHVKALRVVQGKALETLKAMPLKTGMDAVRALDLSLSQERELLGHGTESNPGSAAEDGDGAMDLGEEFPALKRWIEESPRWQSEILPSSGFWPESDPRTNRRLVDLVSEVSSWVNDHVRSGAIPRSSPFHVMVTWSFRLERDRAVVEAMKEKIVELSEEFERQRVRLGIDREDPDEWQTLGIERPGEPHGSRLQWGQAFGIEGGPNDPVTFVAMRIRAAGAARES